MYKILKVNPEKKKINQFSGQVTLSDILPYCCSQGLMELKEALLKEEIY